VTDRGAAGESVATARVRVVCLDAEGSNRRPATAASNARHRAVMEYVAAPGQFINEGADIPDMAAAIAYAESRLASGVYVSLGGFGGYITVDFDHSIDDAHDACDFTVTGNQIADGSEPGVVWVAQDTNGNGLPDDEWYELKHSEYGLDRTRQFYAVTYCRPAASGMDVVWRDNYGATGRVDYLGEFHRQPYYYPAWIGTDSYTLFGTCIEARNFEEPRGAGGSGGAEGSQPGGGSQHWVNSPYDWGYADNFGSDRIGEGGEVGFDIANAVNLDGSPAGLEYIDFVKVVGALNAKSGWLGEVSTEVAGLGDLNLAR
jgi:hypothetical protein